MAGLTTRRELSVELERRLGADELAQDGRLPSERALAETYGVSRPFVREALRGLEARGLIAVTPRRGAYLRRPSASDAAVPLDGLLRRQRVTPREFMEARRIVERDAARLAARRASPPDRRALRHAQARLDASGDLLERARWDVAFHALVAHASHNRVIETMSAAIAGLLLELVLRSLADPDVARAGLPFHHALLDAIERGDEDAAGQAIDEHLRVADLLYGSDLEQDLDSLARRELEAAFGPAASLDHALDLEGVAAAVDEAIEAGA